MQSAETGLAVLLAFVGADSLPMLKTIAERANMAPAKVHRYLVSLSRMGFVQQDLATGRYRLGESALRLGYAALQAIDVVQVARPLLQELRESSRNTVVLALWGSAGATIAIQEIQLAPITASARVGDALPLLASSTGRTFGSWLPRNMTARLLKEALAQVRRQNPPEMPRTLEEVEDIFADIRERGLARITGQLNPLVHALSAPVFDGTGGIAAVVSVMGPSGQFDSAWDGPTATALSSCAVNISRLLGHVPTLPAG